MWAAGDVPSNTTIAFSLTAKLNLPQLAQTVVLTNQIEISSDLPVDDLTNNSDVWVTTVGSLKAAFASNSPVSLGETSVFTNMTTGPGPITYEWDLGDGSLVVTDANPVHVYGYPNTYTVVMTATNPAGSEVVTDTHTVIPVNKIYLPVILNGTTTTAAVPQGGRIPW